MNCKKIILILILFFSISNTFIFSNNIPNILILHSYHKGYEWTDSLNNGIINNIDKDVNIYIEYMDAIRNTDKEYFELLKNIYDHKYTKKNIIFDVIICSDDQALNFLLDIRHELFNNVPIVFSGINDFKPSSIEGHKNITGINEEISTKETIDIALQLHQPEKLYIISDNRLTGRINVEKVRSLENDYKDKVQFVYFEELEKNELSTHLKNTEKNNVIIYLSYLSTPSGETLSVEESIKFVKKYSNLPIYGMWDFLIPYGVLGGKVAHGYNQGEESAKKAMKILEGIKADDIPIMMNSPNKYVFNGRQLHEYQISERILPYKSIIINRQPMYLLEQWDDLIADSFFGYDLFENHGSIMILVDPSSGVILDANRSAKNYYDYDILIGMNISEINVLSEEEILMEMEKAVKFEQNYFNYRHKLGSGEIRDVEVYPYPIELNDSQLLFSLIIDVTEKIMLEKKLRETLDQHKRAEEFAKFGHWIFDLNTNIVESSYGARNLYGVDDDSLNIQQIQKFPLPEYREMLDEALRDLLTEGKTYDVKFEIKRDDGEILWIHSIADYSEEDDRVFGIIHDITDVIESEQNLIRRTRNFIFLLSTFIIILIMVIIYLYINIKIRKRTQTQLNKTNQELEITNKNLEKSYEKIENINEELEASNEELEAANKELEDNYNLLEDASNELRIANEAKSSFLAKISHELRTPMNGIMGGSYLLLKAKKENEINEYTKLIYKSANRLMPIIDDLLDVSKIEKTYLKLSEENTNLNEEIEKIYNKQLLKAKEKGLEMKINNNIEKDTYVKIDKEKLDQVLTNITNNAIEYTENGEIEITINSEDFLLDKKNIKFEIKDTGVGIKEDFKDKVFKPFEQQESYLTRKHQGLGVGLSIAKEIIEKMKGKITFNSEEGKGTIFYFNLIVNKTNKPEKSKENKNDKTNQSSKIKILAAEDDEIGVILLKELFKNEKYTIDIALDGEEALELYKKNKYDIILMDIQMPIMDGIESTKAIRFLEKDKKFKIPIIAVTGHVHDADKHKCYEAGMNDFITKPYNFEEITSKIEKHI